MAAQVYPENRDALEEYLGQRIRVRATASESSYGYLLTDVELASTGEPLTNHAHLRSSRSLSDVQDQVIEVDVFVHTYIKGYDSFEKNRSSSVEIGFCRPTKITVSGQRIVHSLKGRNAKLPDGSWGIGTRKSAKPGDLVEVHSYSGYGFEGTATLGEQMAPGLFRFADSGAGSPRSLERSRAKASPMP